MLRTNVTGQIVLPAANHAPFLCILAPEERTVEGTLLRRPWGVFGGVMPFEVPPLSKAFSASVMNALVGREVCPEVPADDARLV
jgi:hypothetical protein